MKTCKIKNCNYKKGTMTLLEWRCKQLGITMTNEVDPREFELCVQAQQIGY